MLITGRAGHIGAHTAKALPQRPGDPPSLVAAPSHIAVPPGRAQRSAIETIVADAVNWHRSPRFAAPFEAARAERLTA